MKQVLQSFRNGRLIVADVPAPTVGSGQILVRTRTSLISAGTERSTVEFARKSLAGKAMSRLDLVAKVIAKARSEGLQETLKMVQRRLGTPAALGYSCAGEVLAIGENVDEFRIGDRVACAGQNYASHAEFVCVPKNLAVRMPDEVSFTEAAYVTLGAIALQGVRQAAVSLSECVVVIGLGLLGQITVQLLKANGCRVIGCDLSRERCGTAAELGADAVADPGALARTVDSFTAGHGADAVIITASTPSDQPVMQAAEISRKKGRIIVVGAVGMNLPREPFYRRELDLRLSMSYGPGRYDPDYEEAGHDYPLAYVRWTERRNMEAFLDLVRAGRIDLKRLTTHRYDVDDAAEAYSLVTDSTQPAVGILLSYDESEPQPQTKKILVRSRDAAAEIGLGLIGAGTHVMDRIVPAVMALRGVEVRGVCTSSGRTADAVARQVRASYATTRTEDILDDPTVTAVVIGTRHNLHARLLTAALERGKHVFVEKPLCLNESELDAITAAYEKAAGSGLTLFVGFNRRYSRHTEEALRFLEGRRGPLSILYRINAGPLAADHWLLDENVGGGRIIGECCHFVDLAQMLCQARIRSVFAVSPEDGHGPPRNEATLALQLADGSTATIVYTGAGDTALPKERCEIFGEQASLVLDDFRVTSFFRNGKRKLFKTGRQDKGFAREMEVFAQAVRNPQLAGQRFEELHAVSEATFRALDSILSGRRFDLRPCPISVVGEADARRA